MRSVEVLPCPRLRPFVKLIWCLELDATGPESAPAERIAPDGVVELVFHYRDPMALRFAGAETAVQPRSSAVTLTRRFVEISPSGPTGLVSVRCWPWGACSLLDLPVSELADRLVDAEDLWGASVRDLEERLAATTSLARRVAWVEEFLLSRLRADRGSASEPIVRTIWRCGGAIRVAELCSQLGLTQRTLERTFAASVGMPPRSYIRLARFLHATARLRGGGVTSLTRLAHDCGYYDQAHFAADVRAFSGMTPSELMGAAAFSALELE